VTQIDAMNYAAMNSSIPACELTCPINAFNFTASMVAAINSVSRFATDNADALAATNQRYAGHVTIEDSASCREEKSSVDGLPTYGLDDDWNRCFDESCKTNTPFDNRGWRDSSTNDGYRADLPPCCKYNTAGPLQACQCLWGALNPTINASSRECSYVTGFRVHKTTGPTGCNIYTCLTADTTQPQVSSLVTGSNALTQVTEAALSAFNWSHLPLYHGPTPIPTFEEFVAAHEAIKSVIGGSSDARRLAALGLDNRFDGLINLGYLAFAPDNADVRRFVKWMGNKYPSFKKVYYKTFATEGDMIAYATNGAVEDDRHTWALITFHSL